jgi:hypothetical protein
VALTLATGQPQTSPWGHAPRTPATVTPVAVRSTTSCGGAHYAVASCPVATDHLNLYDAQAKRQRAASQAITEANQVRWLLGSDIGRQIVARWFRRAHIFDTGLINPTATTQAGLVAVHEFVKEELLVPALKHCPDLLIAMQKETDERSSGATNTH